MREFCFGRVMFAGNEGRTDRMGLLIGRAKGADVEHVMRNMCSSRTGEDGGMLAKVLLSLCYFKSKKQSVD